MTHNTNAAESGTLTDVFDREACSKDHDATRDLSTLERVIRFVDLRERIAPGQQLVDLQLAGAVEVDQLRDVVPWPRGTVDRAGDGALLEDQRHHRHRDLGGDRRHADDYGKPALREAVVRLPHRLR